MFKRIKHSCPKYKQLVRRRKAIKNLKGEVMYHIYYSTRGGYIQTINEGEKQ